MPNTSADPRAVMVVNLNADTASVAMKRTRRAQDLTRLAVAEYLNAFATSLNPFEFAKTEEGLLRTDFR